MSPKSLLFLAVLPLAAQDDWRSQGILHLDRSPHARLRSVPVRAVRLQDGFWAARRKVNVERSIPTLLELLEQHGVVDNFLRLTGRKNVPRQGPLYTDSDIYKWMEAAAFALQSEDRPDLRAKFDELTEIMLAAQEPSGYLNTYYVEERRSQRFKEMDRGHELYCLGHMLQAAIAYYRATGNRRLLDGGIKFVHYLTTVRPLLTGHPELELALVELYRVTRDPKHLELARYLLSGVERERLKLTDSQVQYMFSGIPFTSRTKFEGHAVRAMYAASGAADLYAETGDPAYRSTLETLWQDLMRGKMYITGGVGSRSRGEVFGEDYELPNLLAYTESCAAIGNMMWNWRLLQNTGEARFADVLERALYNGVNSGMSLNGTLYCYRNPLELRGEKIRNPWYSTTCCPPNLQRVLASLPGYMYSTSGRDVWVHLYHASEYDWQGVRIGQKTDYPHSGAVELSVTPAKPESFTLNLRIPAWATGAKATVNGKAVAAKAGAYLPITRHWQEGDRVTLDFNLETRLTRANPNVKENLGRVAVERGPLVYCAEQIDQKDNLDDLILGAAPFKPEMRDGLLVLRHNGAAYRKPLAEEPLYYPAQSERARATRHAPITLIPYYAFANREPTAMLVWLRYEN